jgi:TRAP-type C4-dicarboxylate transport system substrate-binding protein
MQSYVLWFPLLLLSLLVSADPFSNSARAEEAPKAEKPAGESGAEAPVEKVKPTHQLRIATLAPRQSGQGKSFQQLRKELKEKTNGAVELKMYHGGVAGDEETVVRKMRVGQLDGALLTSTGLSALVPQVLVLQAPGLIRSYPVLDDVRSELGPELEALFDKAGYKLVSWGDSGQIRIFSQHKVQHPNDLRNVRPWVWRGSITMRAFIEAAGANGVTMGLPEVFSALQTGMVDTVISSSIGVLAFQWHTRLKTISKPGGGIVVGAYVIRKDKLAALPQEAQDHILNSAIEHASEFREGGRKLDESASQALLERLKAVNLWRNQHAWEAVMRDARNSLVGRIYSRSLLSRVEKICGKNY